MLQMPSLFSYRHGEGSLIWGIITYTMAYAGIVYSTFPSRGFPLLSAVLCGRTCCKQAYQMSEVFLVFLLENLLAFTVF